MILPNDTTVAVVDGEKLRLFRNKGVEPCIRLVEETVSDVQPVNQGSGARHRSTSANPDRWRLEEDDFAASAAAHLNRLMLGGEIISLFVIADSRTLGELRRHYHGVTRENLLGDLAKDLTGSSIETIEAALAKA
ncbi:baeRF12 domain-containing protein [Rhizobiales bacterium 3FA27D7]|jgi:protein required for attachment to host cells|uniref:baeRF12 domain-containing protein n=1 Tax=Mesorhizobium sp. 2RAF21 TaxID=3232995 RepID=UPI0010F83FC1